MSSHRCPQRQRRVNNKRSYSDADQQPLSDTDTIVNAPPTVVKYRAISISKVFDWAIDFMSIKHHYALKKDLTSDLAFPPLKVHMLLSFNFENDDENNSSSNNNNNNSNSNNSSNHSSQESSSHNNNNNNNNDDNKDECDIRLWLVVDHENDRLNKHASFDFGVQYLRRRAAQAPLNPAVAIDSHAHVHYHHYNHHNQQRRRPHGYNHASAAQHTSSSSSSSSSSASNKLHQTSRDSHRSAAVDIATSSSTANNTAVSMAGHSSSSTAAEEVWNELNAKQSHCASGSMWGFQIGKSLNELKKFCLPKEDEMLFRFDVEFITKCESQIGYHAPEPMIATQKFASRIEEMWKTGLFTDVTVECPAHQWGGHCRFCDDYRKMILHAHDCNTAFDSLSHSPYEICRDRTTSAAAAAAAAAAYHQKTKINKQKMHLKTNKHKQANSNTNNNHSSGAAAATAAAEFAVTSDAETDRETHCKPKCRTKPSISLNINHGEESVHAHAVDMDADEADEDDIDLQHHQQHHGDKTALSENESSELEEKNAHKRRVQTNANDEDGGGGGGGREQQQEEQVDQTALNMRRKHRFTKNSSSSSSSSNSNSGRRHMHVHAAHNSNNCLDDDDDDDDDYSTYCISAHKAILSSVSSVFYAMLNCNLKERDESRIVIHDICYHTMYHLLNYAYSNQVSHECGDLKALFAAAEKYQIYDLCHICLEKMESMIDMDTVCDLWLFLQRYQCNHHISPDMIKKLEARLFEFMVENYPEFCKLEAFLKLKPKIESKLTMFMYEKQFGAIKT